MDPQSYPAFWQQHNYLPHQTTVFDFPPELSKVPSLSASPDSSTYDQFPGALPQEYYPQIPGEAMHYGSYPVPMTPPEFGSDHDSPYCSPRPLQHVEPAYTHTQLSQTPASTERTHTTSGRRRAQNRAAQRAFRERKEKHARDLEGQLAILSEKYNKLESSHAELNAAYEKLRKTIGLLTEDDVEGEDAEGKQFRRRSSNPETLRKLLEIIHGDLKGIAVKNESQ